MAGEGEEAVAGLGVPRLQGVFVLYRDVIISKKKTL
jgi:hypothetical protein